VEERREGGGGGVGGGWWWKGGGGVVRGTGNGEGGGGWGGMNSGRRRVGPRASEGRRHRLFGYVACAGRGLRRREMGRRCRGCVSGYIC